MKNKIKNYFSETFSLLHEIPSSIVALFVASLIAMNILSNKTIYQSEWLSIDGGFLLSWLPMLIIDLLTIHFGPKHPLKLTIFGIAVNLFICLIFFLASLIPTKTDYTELNKLISGTWFILLSSSIALFVSSCVDITINYSLKKFFNSSSTSKKAFYVRTIVSSLIGQFVDNLLFSVLTFMVFAPIFWDGFSWTFIQCLSCSILFAFIEVALEVVFTPFAYRINKKWNKNKQSANNAI